MMRATVRRSGLLPRPSSRRRGAGPARAARAGRHHRRLRGQPVTGTEGRTSSSPTVRPGGRARRRRPDLRDRHRRRPEDVRTVAVSAGAGNDRVEATTPGWGTSRARRGGRLLHRCHRRRPGDPDRGVVVLSSDRGRHGPGHAPASPRSTPAPLEVQLRRRGDRARHGPVDRPHDARAAGSPRPASTFAPTTVGDAVIDAAAPAPPSPRPRAPSAASPARVHHLREQGHGDFRGTDDAERFSSRRGTPRTGSSTLRGGRDFYSSDGFGSRKELVDGRAGRDQLLLPRRARTSPPTWTRAGSVRRGKRTAGDSSTSRTWPSARGRRRSTARRAARRSPSGPAGRVSADGRRRDVGHPANGSGHPGPARSRRGSVDGGRRRRRAHRSAGSRPIVGGPARRGQRAPAGRVRPRTVRGPALTGGAAALVALPR